MRVRTKYFAWRHLDGTALDVRSGIAPIVVVEASSLKPAIATARRVGVDHWSPAWDFVGEYLAKGAMPGESEDETLDAQRAWAVSTFGSLMSGSLRALPADEGHYYGAIAVHPRLVRNTPPAIIWCDAPWTKVATDVARRAA